MLWGGGLAQMESNAASNGNSLTSIGATVGVRADLADISVVASAYTGKGIGTLLMFSGVAGGGVATNDSTARPSDGGYLQVGYTFNKKTTVAASAGLSRLKNASSGEGGGVNGGNGALRMQLTSYTAGVYHQWTKSVKLTAEITKEHQQGLPGTGGNPIAPRASQIDVSAGILLFF
jgi:hypothetical protein